MHRKIRRVEGCRCVGGCTIPAGTEWAGGGGGDHRTEHEQVLHRPAVRVRVSGSPRRRLVPPATYRQSHNWDTRTHTPPTVALLSRKVKTVLVLK